jgi:putative MATE family efflux protein
MMRDRFRTIFGLSLPIIGGMVSQNVLNLVDLAMVATSGNAAVAAVGIGGFANFLATAFITGMSVGVQAMSARRMGEGRLTEMAVPLNGALIIVACLAIPASLVLFQLVPFAFPLLNPDPEVVEAGVPYLQARLVALLAVGMNFSFRGYWNGVNLSKLYLRTLLVMHASNIFFNWVFIFGHLGAPPMGAAGAGIASAIATYVGTGYYVFLALRHAHGAGFLRGLPGAETFRTIARLAVPSGFQQLAFAAGFTALFWIIGHSGIPDGELATRQVAAANAVINVTLVALLPGIALGLAAASLVGQSLGRGDPDDAYRWAWDVVRVAMLVMGGLGLPMVLVPDLILSPFLHDPETLAVARWPMRVVGMAIALDGVGLVLMHALMGAGATRVTMLLSISTQWGVFLPIAFVLGPVLGHGLLAIWLAQVGYRCLLAGGFAMLWRRRAWVTQVV